MSIKGKKVGFLGAGNMGEAMIKGLTQHGPRARGLHRRDGRAGRIASSRWRSEYGIRALREQSSRSSATRT